MKGSDWKFCQEGGKGFSAIGENVRGRGRKCHSIFIGGREGHRARRKLRSSRSVEGKKDRSFKAKKKNGVRKEEGKRFDI